MHFNEVVRRQVMSPGVYRYSHEVTAFDVLDIARWLQPGGKGMRSLGRMNLVRTISYTNADRSDTIIRFDHMTEKDFMKFYHDIDTNNKDMLLEPLRNSHANSLISFLKDKDVRSLSTLSKEELVNTLSKNPSWLFSFLSTAATGWDFNLSDAYSTSALGVDATDALFWNKTAANSKRTDFFNLSWNNHRSSNSVLFTTQGPPEEIEALEAIPKEADIKIYHSSKQLPHIEFGHCTADLESLKNRDMASGHEVKAGQTRDETIKNVIAKYDDIKLAQELNGKRLFISFETPILVGKPLDDITLYSLAPYIEFRGSGGNVFEAVINTDSKRTDFNHYFRAKPKCWAVFAEISLE